MAIHWNDSQKEILLCAFPFTVTIEEPGSNSVKNDKPAEIETPADPAHATVRSNKETVIEMNVNNKGLGLFVVAGRCLQPAVDGAFVAYIYPGGGAEHDKRLQAFDRVLEVEGKKVTAEMSHEDIRRIFKRRYVMVGAAHQIS